MNNLEKLKLFKDIQSVNDKYKRLDISNCENDLEYNKKLQTLIPLYKNKVDDIKNRCRFLSTETREKLKGNTQKDIYKTLIDLNNFSFQKCNSLLKEDIEYTSLKAVLFTTLDELVLINHSIRDKHYLKDKNTYFYVYEKIVTNAFMTLLVLKDVGMDKDKVNSLSQAVLSQIQVLSIISI